MENSKQVDYYIDQIEKMECQAKVVDFLNQLAYENPNDAILGSTIRLVVDKMNRKNLSSQAE